MAVLHLLKCLDKKRFKKAFDNCDFKKSILKANFKARSEIDAFLANIGYKIRDTKEDSELLQEDFKPTYTQLDNKDPLKDKYSKLIVINPNAASSFKYGFCYGPSYYVKLAHNLALEYPNILFVILCYGDQDFNLDNCHIDNLKFYINKGSLMNVIALLEQCDLLISPSTGPAHIADNLGKDVIGAFPYYDKIRWAPNGLMTVAQNQKSPSITPHNYALHFIKKKLVNGIDANFDKFYAMCKKFILKNML